MKKSLLLFVSVLSISMMSYAQMDTVIGFTFPVNTGLDSLNANIGDTLNLGYDIRFESESAGTSDSVTLTNGVYSSSYTDYAATANSWENGANDKYFSIKFKTGYYTNLFIYAKMRSGGANAGPKYFKLQYKISSSGTWTDVSSDTVTIANDWTTGVVDGWALPSPTWNASQSVYVRFLSITNETPSGGTVDSLGVVKIDEIFVLGTNNTGMGDDMLSSIRIFPNPASDFLMIDQPENINLLQIISSDGRLITSISHPTSGIDISQLTPGQYIIRLVDAKQTVSTRNLIVE